MVLMYLGFLWLVFSFATPVLVWASALSGFALHRVGSDADRVSEPRPGLLLMGGGGDVDEAVRWFLERADGGDVVVLRASGGDGYNAYFYRELGVTLNSVTTIVTTRRKASSDEQVLRHVRDAEAIFFAGGDQSKYWNLWRGTPLLQALNEHLAKGTPFGGTSAGLAVLGEFSYVADHRHNLSAQEALRDPYHPWITISNGFLDTPLLKNVITDSHFMERARLGRLATFVARLESETASGLMGLGIDEATAMLVDGTGGARVITEREGQAWIVQLVSQPERMTEGEPLAARFAVIGLGPDSAMNLKSREVHAPASFALIAAAEGKLISVEEDSSE